MSLVDHYKILIRSPTSEEGNETQLLSNVTEKEIESLQPGTKYTVSIKTMLLNKSSESAVMKDVYTSK